MLYCTVSRLQLTKYLTVNVIIKHHDDAISGKWAVTTGQLFKGDLAGALSADQQCGGGKGGVLGRGDSHS